MITYMLERREELRMHPETAGRAVETGGEGSEGNTAHLNRTTPMELKKRSIIEIASRKR